ncbi:unnamed protein product [Meganyctiphanes norvegica]|uniref:Uncharacterized protein n=1 Tax=Meganyctiphanes norvegica TaxID=48144 RepID=A0AAV2RZS9_MEGNR
MPINTQEIMSLASQLSEENNMQVSIKESAKGGVIAGTATFLGGLLGGPIGLAMGGTVGGLTAAYMSKGKFKSVASIIMNDMTLQQQQRLATSLWGILNEIDASDITTISLMILAPDMKTRLVGEIVNYFQSQMHMQITM